VYPMAYETSNRVRRQGWRVAEAATIARDGPSRNRTIDLSLERLVAAASACDLQLFPPQKLEAVSP
jgi:hypothetical protein